MPTTVICVRHGETNANKFGMLQGLSDIEGLNDLNETGFEQARSTAEKIEQLEHNVEFIISSPLTRARQTADVIADRLGLYPLQHEGLRERGYGLFEGVFWRRATDDIQEGLNFIKSRGHEFGMETDEQVHERIEEFKKCLRRHFRERVVLVVAHGGYFRSWFAKDGHYDPVPEIHNCSIHVIHI